MSGWIEVSVQTSVGAADAVAEALRPLAYAGGVAQEQLGDPADLDPAALLPFVNVKIYWPAGEDSARRRARVARLLQPLLKLDLGAIEAPAYTLLGDVDWAEAWKAHYRPFRIGRRFWLTPSWTAAPAEGEKQQEDDLVITLDPGMAFGTGLHATTRLCLVALEAELQAGQSVLDVGTGSGILAIAAARLGASRVLATDNDGLAVAAAGANVARNGVGDVVTVQEGSLPADGRYDIVVVNILAPVIRRLVTADSLLTRGELFIFSGLIEGQIGEVTAVIESAGGAVVDRFRDGEWAALIVTAPKPKPPWPSLP